MNRKIFSEAEFAGNGKWVRKKIAQEWGFGFRNEGSGCDTSDARVHFFDVVYYNFKNFDINS